MLILKSTNTVDISAVILLDLSFENWEADCGFETRVASTVFHFCFKWRMTVLKIDIILMLQLIA